MLRGKVNLVEQENLVVAEALALETRGGHVVGSGGGNSYSRVDPKFWLAAPIRHAIFGCEFRRPNR